MAQPVPFNTVKAIAAFKNEATPGTAETVAAADHNLRIRDIELTTEIASYLLEYASGDHSVAGAVMGMSSGGINFTIDLKAGSAAGICPKWMKAAMFTGHRQEARIVLSADLVTINSVAGNVIVDHGAPVAITPQVFTSDHITTMTALCAKIVTAGGAGTVATVGGANNRTIYVTHPTKTIGVSGFAVTLGASQATVALSTAICEDGTKDFVTATGSFYLVPPSGNGVLVTIKGMRGKAVIGFDGTGNPITLKVENAIGGLVSMTDAAIIALTSPDTTDVPSTLGITLTDGATDMYVSSMKIDNGLDNQLLESGQDTTGVFAAHTATRAPRLTWNPHVNLEASSTAWTRWKAGTQTAVAYAGPTVASQKFRLSIPKVQILEMKRGSRNGADTWEQTSLIVKDPGVAAYELSIGA